MSEIGSCAFYFEDEIVDEPECASPPSCSTSQAATLPPSPVPALITAPGPVAASALSKPPLHTTARSPSNTVSPPVSRAPPPQHRANGANKRVTDSSDEDSIQFHSERSGHGSHRSLRGNGKRKGKITAAKSRGMVIDVNTPRGSKGGERSVDDSPSMPPQATSGVGGSPLPPLLCSSPADSVVFFLEEATQQKSPGRWSVPKFSTLGSDSMASLYESGEEGRRVPPQKQPPSTPATPALLAPPSVHTLPNDSIAFQFDDDTSHLSAALDVQHTESSAAGALGSPVHDGHQSTAPQWPSAPLPSADTMRYRPPNASANYSLDRVDSSILFDIQSSEASHIDGVSPPRTSLKKSEVRSPKLVTLHDHRSEGGTPSQRNASADRKTVVSDRMRRLPKRASKVSKRSRRDSLVEPHLNPPLPFTVIDTLACVPDPLPNEEDTNAATIPHSKFGRTPSAAYGDAEDLEVKARRRSHQKKLRHRRVSSDNGPSFEEFQTPPSVRGITSPPHPDTGTKGPRQASADVLSSVRDRPSDSEQSPVRHTQADDGVRQVVATHKDRKLRRVSRSRRAHEGDVKGSMRNLLGEMCSADVLPESRKSAQPIRTENKESPADGASVSTAIPEWHGKAYDFSELQQATSQTAQWRAFNEAQKQQVEQLKRSVEVARRQDRTLLEDGGVAAPRSIAPQPSPYSAPHAAPRTRLDRSSYASSTVVSGTYKPPPPLTARRSSPTQPDRKLKVAINTRSTSSPSSAGLRTYVPAEDGAAAPGKRLRALRDSTAAATMADLLGLLWPPSKPSELFFVTGSRLTVDQQRQFYEAVELQEQSEAIYQQEVRATCKTGSWNVLRREAETMLPSQLRSSETRASRNGHSNARYATPSVARRKSRRSQVIRDAFDILDVQHCGVVHSKDLPALKRLLEDELVKLEHKLSALQSATHQSMGTAENDRKPKPASQTLLACATQHRLRATQPLNSNVRRIPDGSSKVSRDGRGALDEQRDTLTYELGRHIVLLSLLVNVVIPLSVASRIPSLDFPIVAMLIFSALARGGESPVGPEQQAWRGVVGHYFDVLS